MNTDFLKSLGIDDANPRVVLDKLDAKEEELYDKRDLAESTNSIDKVKEIDDLLKKIEVERKQVKKDIKNVVPLTTEKNTDVNEQSQEIKNKKEEILDKINKKKQEEAKTKNSETANKSDNNVKTTSSSTNNVPQVNSNVTASSKTNAPTNHQNVQSQQSVVAATASSSVVASTARSGNGNYSKGLQYYQKQDYTNAFQCLFPVAEEKTPADQNAVQEQTKACYLISMMYRNGLGQKQDLGRSKHYLKRAADFGYDQAQYEYGISVLSQHNTSTEADLKARKEGLEYVEKAADAGLVEAMKKYVDFALHSADSNKKIIDKARQYIPILKNQVDSYESSQYDGFLKSLTETEKKAKKKASYPKKFIIGELLFLIGVIYLFKGLNGTFFREELASISRFIPNIPDFLIIKWKQLTEITDMHMSHQGIFGCWLIVLGNIIRGLGVKQVIPEIGRSKCKIFGTIIKVIIILICVLHFIANIQETGAFLGNGGIIQFIALVGSIAIGRLIGMILYRIIK